MHWSSVVHLYGLSSSFGPDEEMNMMRMLLERINEFRFWHGPRTGDGRLAEVARHRRRADG